MTVDPMSPTFAAQEMEISVALSLIVQLLMMAICQNLKLADQPRGQVKPTGFALSVATDRSNFILYLLLKGKDT